MYNIQRCNNRGMAKFGIALGSGPRGHGFESRYSDQKIRQVSTCRIFLSKPTGLVYHHASACISSRAATPPLYLITPSGVYICRLDDIQNFVLMICNSCEIDDIQCYALILTKLYSIIIAKEMDLITETKILGDGDNERSNP